jgi:hypothetical protein
MTDKVAGPDGSALSERLGLAPERAAFEAWQSDNGRWPKAVERDGEGYRLAASHAAWTAWRAGWVRAEKMARERCARICEQYGDEVLDDSGLTASMAARIRQALRLS